MSAKNITLKVVDSKGEVSIHKFTTGKLDGESLQIKARNGVNYVLAEDETTYAPDSITLERVGEDLLIYLADTDSADIIIEGHFKLELAKDNLVIGQHENGQYYSFIPITGEVGELVYVLPERVSSVQALGGDTVDLLYSESSNVASADSGISSMFENTAAWGAWAFLGSVVVGLGAATFLAHKSDNDDKPANDSNPEVIVDTPVNETITASVDFTGTTLQANTKTDVVFELIAGKETEALAGFQANEIKEFVVGSYENQADADRIQLNNILLGATKDNIAEYIKVEAVDNKTTISIDRDGSADTFVMSEFITLDNINTTLDELLQGGQIAF